MSYRLLPSAEEDLHAIWQYIAMESGSLETADRAIETIAKRLRLLGGNPRIGRRRDHDLRPGLRSFAAGQYVILYRLAETGAVVLRVWHGNRDIAGWSE